MTQAGLKPGRVVYVEAGNDKSVLAGAGFLVSS